MQNHNIDLYFMSGNVDVVLTLHICIFLYLSIFCIFPYLLFSLNCSFSSVVSVILHIFHSLCIVFAFFCVFFLYLPFFLQYDTAAAQKMSASLPSASEVAGDLDAVVLEATPGHKHSRKAAQHTSPAPPRCVYMTIGKQRFRVLA